MKKQLNRLLVATFLGASLLPACGGGGGEEKDKKSEDSDVVQNDVEGPIYSLSVDGSSMREMEDDIKMFYGAAPQWSVKADVGDTSSTNKNGLSLAQALALLERLKFQSNDKAQIEVAAYKNAKESEVYASNSADRLNLSCEARTEFDLYEGYRAKLELCSRWQREGGRARNAGDDNVIEKQTMSYSCVGTMRTEALSDGTFIYHKSGAQCKVGYLANTSQSAPKYVYPAKSKKFSSLDFKLYGIYFKQDAGNNFSMEFSDLYSGCRTAEAYVKYDANPTGTDAPREKRYSFVRNGNSNVWTQAAGSEAMPNRSQMERGYQDGRVLEFNLICSWNRVGNEPLFAVPVSKKQ